MKLITHNLLMCNRKGCTANNFPLKLIATNVQAYNEDAQIEYSKAMMQRMAQKVDLAALRATVKDL